VRILFSIVPIIHVSWKTLIGHKDRKKFWQWKTLSSFVSCANKKQQNHYGEEKVWQCASNALIISKKGALTL
tara:strand:- start:754 stop:969 length:216 start_codon:yes stop_codon:yes gene_type:complete